MADTLTWLHLSDLHCCPQRTGWDADRVLRALARDLEELAAEHELRPDLIFFTGDAAFGELPRLPIRDQFAAAGRFFDEIALLCKVPRENVFLVPGNHDVDRGQVSGPMTEWLDARARSHKLDEVRELVRKGGRDWKTVMDRLDAYRTFLQEHGYHHLLGDPKRLIYAARRCVGDINVAVAGLNSAWSCGRQEEEKGRLWLAADYQVAVLEPELEGAEVVIGLVHHPRGWFVPAEDPEVERTFERVFDFHLHGHEHQAWVKPTDGHVRVAAGAAYDRSDRANGYNLVRLDFVNERAEVWLRAYEKAAGAWQQRVIKGKTTAHGVWKLDRVRCFARRPRKLSAVDDGGASPPGGSVVTDLRAETEVHRLPLSNRTPEDLLRSCRAQTSDNMHALLGSPTDLTKKYIPELHLPRSIVDRALQKFLNSSESSESTLALVADSGIGKTCCMCYQATNLLANGQPVLFLRGSELEQRLLDRLAEEFSCIFSETISPSALVKRLSQIADDESLLIFLDAIDEWTAENAYRQLGSLAKHLSGTRVKLVVSCKASRWSGFVEHRGTPTDFGTNVARYDGQPGLVFGPLEQREFDAALEKYKKFYGFNGAWDERLLEEAKRSPFFMRIAFEVAQEYGLHELRESSREIFDRYYRGCLAKTPESEVSEQILVATAEALFEANVDRLEITRLRSSLELRATEKLPEELFLCGILERVSGESAGLVRFAFEGLRNYVIAFKARRWHDQPVDAFRDQIRHMDSEGIREESLVAYYKLASEEHKRVLDQKSYDLAVSFLATYKRIIQTHFAAFEFSFPYGDVEKVGFVLEANLWTNQVFQYGLRCLRHGESEVLILPTASANLLSGSLRRVRAGGLTFRIKLDGTHNLDPHHELLRVEFACRIPRIVREGGLNEEATPDLSRELIGAAVLSKPEILNEPKQGPGKEGLPLSTKRLNYWLLFQQHWWRFERQLVASKISSGKIPVTRQGPYISYSPPQLTQEERQDILRRCDALLTQGVKVSRPRYDGRPDLAGRLARSVFWLNDDAVIEGPLFAKHHWQHFPRRSPDETDLLEYHRHFMKSFLTNYERLVATNFPTLKQHFTLYRELPVLVLTAIHDAPPGTALRERDVATVFLAPEGFTLDESDVKIVEFSHLAESVSEMKSVEIEGRSYRSILSRPSDAGHLVGSSHHHPDLGLKSWFTILRDYIYSWIKAELEKVGRALGELEGVENLDFRG